MLIILVFDKIFLLTKIAIKYDFLTLKNTETLKKVHYKVNIK